jgi:hypothetical protein
MSEYQYYEFLALDRPLDARQQEEVRALSTRIMLRFPRSLLDLDVAEQYCVSDRVAAWTVDEFLVLDVASEDDSGEWVEGAEGSLSAIVGVRAEIAAGDLRPLYLAWLAGYGTWERDEYAFEGGACRYNCGAPRGADCPSGGESPSPLCRRSGGVKLAAA